jgi:hypothetical protein
VQDTDTEQCTALYRLVAMRPVGFRGVIAGLGDLVR